jgi:hypothetical protein
MAAKGFSTSNYISNAVGGVDGPITLFCWFRPESFGAGSSQDAQSLVYVAEPTANGHSFILRVQPTRAASMESQSTTASRADSTTLLSPSTWYAIGGSDDAAGTNRQIWLNGVSEETVATARNVTGATEVHIGLNKVAGSLGDPILTSGLPYFRGAGSGVGAVGVSKAYSVAPAFPATVIPQDIAFLQCLAVDTLSAGVLPSINTPAGGWALLYSDTVGTAGRQSIFWKECDGTEDSATVTVTGAYNGPSDASSGIYCRIYVFGDVALSSFAESGGSNNGTDTTAEIASITSSVDNCLGLFFCGALNDVTQAVISGNTATWDKAGLSTFTSNTGVDGSLGMQQAPLVTAGTFSGGSSTLGTGPVGWITRAFSMKPKNNGAQGAIAHCAVWNVELSADDHAELAAGLSPLMVRPDALTFYAPLLDNATLNEIVTVNTLTGSLSFEDDG